jgi:transposase
MALFPPGKGGGERTGYGWKGKGVTLHSLSDEDGHPLALLSTAAGESEKDQVIALMNRVRVPLPQGRPKQRPKILEADKGYDANWLRESLRKLNIKPLISKRKWKNKKARGRPPGKQCIRWKSERLFSWYQRKFRRFVVRWERLDAPWQGFLSFGFILLGVQILVG